MLFDELYVVKCRDRESSYTGAKELFIPLSLRAPHILPTLQIVELCVVKYRDSESLYMGAKELSYCTLRAQLLMALHDDNSAVASKDRCAAQGKRCPQGACASSTTTTTAADSCQEGALNTKYCPCSAHVQLAQLIG